jgi:hypothetical protein
MGDVRATSSSPLAEDARTCEPLRDGAVALDRRVQVAQGGGSARAAKAAHQLTCCPPTTVLPKLVAAPS